MSQYERTVELMLLFGELQANELESKARPTAHTACADDVDTAVKADEPSLEPSVPPRPGDQECESEINPPVTSVRTLSAHQSHTAAAASDQACIGDRESQSADSTVDADSGVCVHTSEHQPADSTDATSPGTTALQQRSSWPTPASACWQRTQTVVARVAALLEWMLSPVQLDQLAQNLHAPGETCQYFFAEEYRRLRNSLCRLLHGLLAGHMADRSLDMAHTFRAIFPVVMRAWQTCYVYAGQDATYGNALDLVKWDSTGVCFDFAAVRTLGCLLLQRLITQPDLIQNLFPGADDTVSQETKKHNAAGVQAMFSIMCK